MKVLVSSKSFEVTNALRQRAKDLSEKLVKYNPKITKVRVFLENVGKKSNDPSGNLVKVLVEIPGRDVAVKKNAVDMYEALVKAFDVAGRHVRKQLEKVKTKRRGG